jgi:hypothetical protein
VVLLDKMHLQPEVVSLELDWSIARGSELRSLSISYTYVLIGELYNWSLNAWSISLVHHIFYTVMSIWDLSLGLK